jgi:hypothetical protein
MADDRRMKAVSRRAVHTDILPFSRELSSLRRPSHVDDSASPQGLMNCRMIIRMAPSLRPQHRYDHRLQDLVHNTGDVTFATDLGVPRSTARGWVRKPPRVAVTMDVTTVKTWELQQEVLELR